MTETYNAKAAEPRCPGMSICKSPALCLADGECHYTKSPFADRPHSRLQPALVNRMARVLAIAEGYRNPDELIEDGKASEPVWMAFTDAAARVLLASGLDDAVAILEDVVKQCPRDWACTLDARAFLARMRGTEKK